MAPWCHALAGVETNGAVMPSAAHQAAKSAPGKRAQPMTPWAVRGWTAISVSRTEGGGHRRGDELRYQVGAR